MPPARIIPALDEAEDGDPGFDLRLEFGALERGEQALCRRAEGALSARRVVVGVADRAHRRTNTGITTALAELD